MTETNNSPTKPNEPACTECSRLASRVEELEQVMIAIARALKEPAGGEFWCARKLADKVGIYNDDLDGMRVLLKLAERVLAGAHAEEKPK